MKLDFTKNPIAYVTRDLERGLGLSVNTPGYLIIANSTPLAKEMAIGRDDILLIKESKLLDTWQLLEHPIVVSKLASLHAYKLSILVFKNTKQIERICEKNSWKLLNPSAKLADKIEAKVKQTKFLPELNNLYPKFEVTTCELANFQAHPFILQYNHAHTGEGTIYIKSDEQLNELKNKFPKREIKISKFISGQIFTNNNVIHNAGILIGNISYQITGLKPYTENPFATVGNDWGKAAEILSDENIKQYKDIAKKVGDVLKEKGWKGMFGIDVIFEEKTKKMYLIEINARQPQSAVYESKLQECSKINNLKLTITTFEAHLAALTNTDLKNTDIVKINTGSQIIDRREKNVKYIQTKK